MLNGPFTPWPLYTEEEAEAVSRVLLSNKVNYWTGLECREFEKEFAQYVGCQYAVALANGTVALDLALKVLGVGEGYEVIVTSRTFLASVSAIVNAGATPIFADVDRDSQNITANSIEPMISSRTKAIICVHLAGWPCEMDSIIDLASKHGCYIIEDCAQAHGATYNGRPVGSIGDIGCWSFCQDKIMSTGGEGGMVATNNKDLWSKMWSYKDHGKSWDAIYDRQHPPGFKWLHESFGTNWRMTEMQAVIGRIQLKKMPLWHKVRLAYANQIWNEAKKIAGIRVPIIPENIEHAAYKCYFFTDGNKQTRDAIVSAMNEEGVPCFSGTCSEVYLEKAFDGSGFRPEKRLTIAKELGDTSLAVLVHPSLTQDEIDKTCKSLISVMSIVTSFSDQY